MVEWGTYKRFGNLAKIVWRSTFAFDVLLAQDAVCSSLGKAKRTLRIPPRTMNNEH
jgi:hypothetical protein